MLYPVVSVLHMVQLAHRTEIVLDVQDHNQTSAQLPLPHHHWHLLLLVTLLVSTADVRSQKKAFLYQLVSAACAIFLLRHYPLKKDVKLVDETVAWKHEQ
jgi:hypothetical protein